MRPHRFTSKTKIDAFQLKDFLGVDFTTHESEVNQKRSPDSVNVISGFQGSMDKRFGTEIFKTFDDPIYAIKTIKTYVYEPVTLNKIPVEVIVVHTGTTLWAYNPYLDVWQEATAFDEDGAVTVVLQERKTNFIEFNNQTFYTIMQNNWINDENDLLIMYCNANTLAGHEGEITFYITVNDPYSILVYYPTTSIGRSPNGLTSNDFESPNLMVNIRKNKFLSNATDTTFVLDYIGNIYSMNAFGGIVQQMQPDGSFSSSLHDASNNPITVTYNASTHSITFSAVPHATYISGQDNIEVTFRTATDAKVITSTINDYSSFSTYGLSGTNNLIFLCDHSEIRFRNKEIWLRIIKDDDPSSNNARIYLDENNYSLLGSNRKVGYSKVGQYLVLHGEREGSSPVAYLKTIGLDDAGELFTANTPTTSQLGAIATHSFANLRDDPIFLSESGISAISINAITNIQSIQDRGFYINQKLLQEPNIEDAYAFIFDNKYFICVNNNVYIADPRSKYSERLAYSESFQYEWFYWEGLDIQCHELVGMNLYFGTSDGRLMAYKNADSSFPYCDEINATPTLWATSTEYVKGNVVHDGLENYYICLKDHNSEFYALEDGIYWLSIIKDTSTYQVPILSYWTTPIMNMGNITMLKTLKNLWVRLGKYPHMSTRIYYSTKGLIKEEYDGIFDFSNIDFSRFTFSSDTDPSVMVTNRQERKFMSIQFKVESRDSNPFSLLEIVGKYIMNTQYKG